MKKATVRVLASLAIAGGLALGGATAASALGPGTNVPGVGMVIVTGENGGITYHLYDEAGKYLGYVVQQVS